MLVGSRYESDGETARFHRQTCLPGGIPLLRHQEGPSHKHRHLFNLFLSKYIHFELFGTTTPTNPSCAILFVYSVHSACLHYYEYFSCAPNYILFHKFSSFGIVTTTTVSCVPQYGPFSNSLHSGQKTLRILFVCPPKHIISHMLSRSALTSRLLSYVIFFNVI